MTETEDLGVGEASKKPCMFFTPAVFISWMPGYFLVPEFLKSLMAIDLSFPDY